MKIMLVHTLSMLAVIIVPVSLAQSRNESSARMTQSTKATAAAYTPPKGSPERKAIMDALRAQLKRASSTGAPGSGLEVIFTVKHLKVSDGWAYTEAVPQSADGLVSLEAVSALLRKSESGWEVLETPCLDDPTAECNDFEQIKLKFPSAPSGIFPRRVAN